MRFVALLFASLVTAAVPAVAQTEPTIDPHGHCRSLCAQFYGADPDKRSLCESGCSDARDCMETCASRFPGDEGKRNRCHARCTRTRGG